MFRSRNRVDGLLGSKLYSEQSFYSALTNDLKRARSIVVIESPYITVKRIEMLLPILKRLRKKGVKLVINTKHPEEHSYILREQAEIGINELQLSGATVLFTGNHHRKLAIIDNHILWEGSLNILSQYDSCEIMRRIDSIELCKEMIKFSGLSKWYTRGKL